MSNYTVENYYKLYRKLGVNPGSIYQVKNNLTVDCLYSLQLYNIEPFRYRGRLQNNDIFTVVDLGCFVGMTIYSKTEILFKAQKYNFLVCASNLKIIFNTLTVRLG